MAEEFLQFFPSEYIQLFIHVVFLIGAVAMVAVVVVDQLKRHKIIKDGQAGWVNLYLNYIVAAAAFVLWNIGQDQLAGALQQPEVMMWMVIYPFISHALGKFQIYRIGKSTEAFFSFPDQPSANTRALPTITHDEDAALKPAA